MDRDISRQLVIGISGASGSGKSWLAQKIKNARPDEVTIFDLDSYYKAPHIVSSLDCKNDNPKALNFPDAIAHLMLLKKGQEVQVPVYDFKTHEVRGYKKCKPSPVIIVEGLFAFADPFLEKHMNIKVWISSEENIRFERRVRRDILERGRTHEEILERYVSDVNPGYIKYIRPLRHEADMIFENNGEDSDFQPVIVEMLLAYIDRKKSARCTNA